MRPSKEPALPKLNGLVAQGRVCKVPVDPPP
jgi:hypothetical protein